MRASEKRMNEEQDTDARTAAEQYRAQRQAAEARLSGLEEMTYEHAVAWAELNRSKLEAIARNVSTSETESLALVTEYLALTGNQTVAARFDTPNVMLILAHIIKKIEKICTSRHIPIRDGVVYGVTPRLGLEASQLAVMATSASIISVTQAFPVFCNMVSKAVALSLVQKGDWISWDREEIRVHLKQHPEILVYWTTILASYALFGWPPSLSLPKLTIPQQMTRFQILQAMELFAVAHEYGHHVLQHGVAHSTDATRDHFRDEHEADIFGRLIGLNDGFTSKPKNLYSASGSGAVLMLGALELVRRAENILGKESAGADPTSFHPLLDQRIQVIADADEHADEADRPVFEDMRCCARELLETIWTFAEPVIRDLHANGLRRQTDLQTVGGWLPANAR